MHLLPQPSFKSFDKLLRAYNLIIAITLIVALIPNYQLAINEPFIFTTRVLSLLLPMSIYLLILTLVKRVEWLVLLLFPIVWFGSFAQVMFHSLYNSSVISTNMIVTSFATSSEELNEVLASLKPLAYTLYAAYAVNFLIALYTLIRGGAVNTKQRSSYRKLATSILCVSLIGCAITNHINPNFMIVKQIYPINVYYNAYQATNRLASFYENFNSENNFTFGADLTRGEEREIHILVIGEAVRAANLSLYGYHRNTNPKLGSRDDIVVMPDYITKSNVTHRIVPRILTPNCDEDAEVIYERKSMITAFKECGFATRFISNQPPDNHFIDIFAREADQMISTVGDDVVCYPDGVLLEPLRQALDEEIGDIFVVLHTYGAHFCYSKRYDEQFAQFQSDDTSVISPSNNETIINAYDNSILYLDNLLNEIIEMVDQQDAISSVTYISDHGEDLYDDERKKFLHASLLPTYYQLHVPFISWMSNKYREVNGEKYNNLVANHTQPINTEVIFHTMVDIANIEMEMLNSAQSLMSGDFSPIRRIFIADNNEAVDFFNSGVQEEDLLKFDEMGIAYDRAEVKRVRY